MFGGLDADGRPTSEQLSPEENVINLESTFIKELPEDAARAYKFNEENRTAADRAGTEGSQNKKDGIRTPSTGGERRNEDDLREPPTGEEKKPAETGAEESGVKNTNCRCPGV